MHIPSRRVLECHSLKEHIPALHKLYHHRAQITLDPGSLLFSESGTVAITLLAILHAIDIALRRIPCPVIHNNATFGCEILPFGTRHLVTLDRTPHTSISVNDTLACYGYVLKVLTSDRRLGAPCLKPLIDHILCLIKAVVT